MSFQIILVVEADDTSKSDFLYVNSILNEWYNIRIRNDIKISTVYMGGKGKYKRVLGKINKLQNAYNYIGRSYVIYCFDTDKYDSEPEDKRILIEEEQYCEDNGYDFVWFCHDIEEVFWGHSVPNKDKPEKAKQYSAKHGIKSLNMQKLKARVKGKGKSNILLVLEKYLDFGTNV